MDARAIGLGKSSLVLGKHSGRHALRVRLQELGYTLTPEELNRAFVRFKEIADKKKDLSDRDLEAIVADEIQPVHEYFKLKLVAGLLRNRAGPHRDGGVGQAERQRAEGGRHGYRTGGRRLQGDRPDHQDPEPACWSTRSTRVTGGIDALGEVTLRIQDDGKTYVGHGADTDIVVSSVKAYVTALNKLMANRPPAEIEAAMKPEATGGP